MRFANILYGTIPFQKLLCATLAVYQASLIKSFFYYKEAEYSKNTCGCLGQHVELKENTNSGEQQTKF